MNRFNQRGPPHLDVRSRSLVYLTGVPTSIGGKELKRRLNNQFGRVKFVETFEAWLGHLTGNMVVDFSTYEESEEFMTAVINGRINFLEGAGIQHIGIVGARHFFELIHRNTDVDLFDCGGKPNSTDWRNRRSNRPSGGKPYDRPSPRSNNNGSGSNLIRLGSGNGPPPPPRNETSFSAVGGSVNRSAQGSGRERDRNSPSDEDDDAVGPFPTSSSGSLRNLIKYSIWESKATGTTHFLQFLSPTKANNREPKSPPSPGPTHRRSRTPLPPSPRKMTVDSISRRSASANRRPRHHSISPPPFNFNNHRHRISSFHQPQQQCPNKNDQLNEYNFEWSRGRSPERRSRGEERDSHQNSTFAVAPMVVGLDLTKERMRQARRQHHRYLRTPSPQWIVGGKRNGQIHRSSRSRSRHHSPPHHPPPNQSSSSSSASRRSSGHLFSPIRGGDGLFMFRALPSKYRRPRGGRLGRNNLWKDDYEIIWPNRANKGTAATNKKANKSKGTMEPDIILIDDSSVSSDSTSGIGPSSFYSTPSLANSSKRASTSVRKVHRNPDELEEGELSEDSEEMEVDQLVKEEEKEAEEEEEERFDPDAYEPPFEFVENEDEEEGKGGDNSDGAGQNDLNNENESGGGGNDEPKEREVEDILAGESVADISEINGEALLDETDNEEEEEEGDERPKQSPQNSEIDNDDDEILCLEVRRISIDGDLGGGGGGGPIGIGRKGQRIQLVKSEILDPNNDDEGVMGGDGSSDEPLLLL